MKNLRAKALGAILTLLTLVAVAGLWLPRSNSRALPLGYAPSSLHRVTSEKILRVGYEGYPPYTIIDPANGQLSGHSVDLAEQIAKEAGWSVRWIRTTAETKIPDLQAGRFDIMVEPIFRTIPRAVVVGFSRPYAYFGYAAGIVRKGESRFQTIQDVDAQGVKVVVRLGYSDASFADQFFSIAEVSKRKVDDTSQIFLDVLTRRADIALADVEQVKAFAKEHSSEVETRFVELPPATVPAGFMLAQGDFAMSNFLDSAIDYLEANGFFASLDRKYHLTAVREDRPRH